VFDSITTGAVGTVGAALFSDLLPFLGLIVGVGLMFWVVDELLSRRDKRRREGG